MKVVYKYPFTSGVKFLMPKGSKILTGSFQAGAPCVWAEVNPNEVDVMYYFIKIYGTGHEDVRGTYLCTVFDGAFVWHFYDTNS